jgi:hypothetical protein
MSDPMTARARLRALATILLVAVTLSPGVAIASEPTSGYKSEPPKPPASSQPTQTTPSSGTSPTQEAQKPTQETESSASEAEKPHYAVGGYRARGEGAATAKSLPFTGLDVRREIGLGALLLVGGFAIAAAQRRGVRRRRDVVSRRPRRRRECWRWPS